MLLWAWVAWPLAVVVTLWQLVRRRVRPDPEAEGERRFPEPARIVYWRGDDPDEGMAVFDAIRHNAPERIPFEEEEADDDLAM